MTLDYNGLNNRTMSSDIHSGTWLNVCSGVKKLSWTFDRFLSALLKSIFMYLYYQYYQFFILRVPLSPRAPLREGAFCGNGSRISAADYFREKAQSWMFDQFLNTLNSILMSLYYQYNYSFFINLICYFIISLLYHYYSF